LGLEDEGGEESNLEDLANQDAAINSDYKETYN
jgi:hypothetical protein